MFTISTRSVMIASRGVSLLLSVSPTPSTCTLGRGGNIRMLHFLLGDTIVLGVGIVNDRFDVEQTMRQKQKNPHTKQCHCAMYHIHLWNLSRLNGFSL